MHWPHPGQELAVKTVIRSDEDAGKRQVKRWASVREAKVVARVWMWCPDRSLSDDGRVEAAAVYTHRDGWKTSRSHLGTGQIKVYNSQLNAIVFALRESVMKRDTLQKH